MMVEGMGFLVLCASAGVALWATSTRKSLAHPSLDEARWREAGFEPTDSGWRRGETRTVRTLRGLVLERAFPEGVTMGVRGPHHVADGVALFVDRPEMVAWFSDVALNHARVLERENAHIAEGILRVPTPEGGELRRVAAAIDGLAASVASPPSLDELSILARQHGRRGTVAARALAARAPERLRPLLEAGHAGPQLVAALHFEDWALAASLVDEISVPRDLSQEATEHLAHALATMPEPEARRLASSSDLARAFAALRFRDWDELPDRAWLARHPQVRHRVLEGLHADGRTTRALAEALEVEPWWAKRLLPGPIDEEQLRLLRKTADDPYADPQAHAVVAQLLSLHGGGEDVPRLQGMAPEVALEHLATLRGRLKGSSGGLSLAEQTGGTLSIAEE